MRDVAIRGHMIRLGQLLQYAGLADSGADAKVRIAEGAVSVNGEPVTERGRQLHPGDTVTLGDETVRIV
jgi:ribosome-associated protein